MRNNHYFSLGEIFSSDALHSCAQNVATGWNDWNELDLNIEWNTCVVRGMGFVIIIIQHIPIQVLSDWKYTYAACEPVTAVVWDFLHPSIIKFMSNNNILMKIISFLSVSEWAKIFGCEYIPRMLHSPIGWGAINSIIPEIIYHSETCVQYN